MDVYRNLHWSPPAGQRVPGSRYQIENGGTGGLHGAIPASTGVPGLVPRQWPRPSLGLAMFGHRAGRGWWPSAPEQAGQYWPRRKGGKKGATATGHRSPPAGARAVGRLVALRSDLVLPDENGCNSGRSPRDVLLRLVAGWGQRARPPRSADRRRSRAWPITVLPAARAGTGATDMGCGPVTAWPHGRAPSGEPGRPADGRRLQHSHAAPRRGRSCR